MSAPDGRRGVRRRRSGGPWGLWSFAPLDDAGVGGLLGLARAFCQDDRFSLDPCCDRGLWLRYAAGHGLLGLLGGMGLTGRVEESALVDAARKHYLSNLLRHEQALRACRALIEECAALGAAVSLVKGPSLAADVYGDGGLRGYSDIDALMASEAEARLLVARLAERPGSEVQPPTLLHRLAHPDKLTVNVEGWEIEIAFPGGWVTGPLAEVQDRDRDRLYPTARPGELPRPEPSAYFLLLLEHLVRHIGERLIWFVDLVVFARRSRGELDWSWIGRRLGELKLSGVAGLVGRFCRQQLDPSFPSDLERDVSGVDPLCARLFGPSLVTRGFRGSVGRGHGWWTRFWAMSLQRAGRNWVVTDPGVRRAHAARWMTALVLNALSCRSQLAFRTVQALIGVLGRYGSRFAAWVLTRSGHLDMRGRPG